MGDIEHHWIEEKRKRYRDLFKHDDFYRAGGIFSKKKRQQLLGLVSKTGGKNGTLYNFWYDVREQVKTALIDLQLFIETANEKDVNAVINKDALKNLVYTVLNQPKEDIAKVKIAQMFAEYGLGYLGQKSKNITQAQIDSIYATIDMTKQLTIMELPEGERGEYIIERRGLK
jgi:hypothetical protein